MIDNGFVYAVNKSINKNKKKEESKSKKLNYIIEVCKEKNIQLALTAKKKHFNKNQLKIIQELGFMEYLKINEKYN